MLIRSRQVRRRPRLGTVAAVILLACLGVGAGTAVAHADTAPAKHESHDDKDHDDKDHDDKGHHDKGRDHKSHDHKASNDKGHDDKASDHKVSDRSATPCAASAKACMDLASHQAWLTDGAGHVTYGPVPARGGSAGAPTPTGSFNVLSKDAHYYSTEFHAPMPYSVFFQPGDAFHADNPATASNGCVHLTMAAAQRFFAALNPGDPVQIK